MAGGAGGRGREDDSCCFRCSSCFLASINSAGTPPTVFCAERSSFQRASMNAAAPYLSMNPTRETCIFFGSGVGLSRSSSIPKTYSTTISSSTLISSVTFSATQGRSTEMLTLRRSTFSEKCLGNFVDLMLASSLSLNLESWRAFVPRIPVSAMVIGL